MPLPSIHRTWLRRHAVEILALVVVLVGGLLWIQYGRSGTLVLECADNKFVVEVFAEEPSIGIQRWLNMDERPEFQSWGLPPEGTCKGPCVFHRQGEAGRWSLRLPPGRYTVATHRQSRCGYWGGDSYRTIELAQGEVLNFDRPAD